MFSGASTVSPRWALSSVGSPVSVGHCPSCRRAETVISQSSFKIVLPSFLKSCHMEYLLNKELYLEGLLQPKCKICKYFSF